MTRPLTKLWLGLLLIALVGGLVPAESANTLKHGFVCAKPDPTDVTLVNCTHWNAEHAFAGGATDQVLIWDAAQSDKVRWTNVPPFAVAKAGGTMTGLLTINAGGLSVTAGTVTLPADPTSPLHAATKQYVDARSEVEIIRKTATETVNNSTTLQNDDDLLAALAANETVYFLLHLIQVSGATPDFKFTFTVPASATILWSTPNARIDTAGVLASPIIVNASGTTVAVQGTGSGHGQLVVGAVRNSTTAGNLQLQWAQNTADASDTRVDADSFLMVWRR